MGLVVCNQWPALCKVPSGSASVVLEGWSWRNNRLVSVFLFFLPASVKKSRILYDRTSPKAKRFDLSERGNWAALPLTACLALCNVSFHHSLDLWLCFCPPQCFPPSRFSIGDNQRHSWQSVPLSVPPSNPVVSVTQDKPLRPTYHFFFRTDASFVISSRSLCSRLNRITAGELMQMR